MDKKIVIVDYGLGNLKSVARAFEAIGSPADITNSPEKISAADILILPGVGAFEDGMKGLKDNGLIEPIREFAAKGKPILGICLGMQLLMTESEEFGIHKGLDLIPGRVVPLKPVSEVNIEDYKVPNFGWCDIVPPKEKSRDDWKDTILDNIKSGSDFYFVHSFHVQPEDRKDLLAITDYSQEVCAVIKMDNIMGCQFHPEKSGKRGLEILKSLLNLN